ncbi:MAG: hypothetical protein RR784_07300 [Burkholderiaceae bacterium]
MRAAAALTSLLLAACASSEPAPGWQLGQIDRMSAAQAALAPPVILSPQQKAALDRLDVQILADQERAVAQQAYERAFNQAVSNGFLGIGYGGWGGYPGYWGRPGWAVGWGWYPR